MNQYLRPETLFGTKFEGYLNESVINNDLSTNGRKTAQNMDIFKKEMENMKEV